MLTGYFCIRFETKKVAVVGDRRLPKSKDLKLDWTRVSFTPILLIQWFPTGGPRPLFTRSYETHVPSKQFCNKRPYIFEKFSDNHIFGKCIFLIQFSSRIFLLVTTKILAKITFRADIIFEISFSSTSVVQHF